MSAQCCRVTPILVWVMSEPFVSRDEVGLCGYPYMQDGWAFRSPNAGFAPVFGAGQLD